MNSVIPEAKLASITEAIFQGRKIEAIKQYREWTGAGLADAKAAVERLELELRKASPERFTTAPSGKGCLGVVVMACAVAVMIILWIVRR
jgi:hypothetical protein